MSPVRNIARRSGWRGICLVASTYIYFLIFAQFAFLNRLAALGIANDHLKVVMAAMALGGISLSLLAPRFKALASPAIRMRSAFLLCGAAALCTVLPMNLAASIGFALLIGCGLGLLTVTLVTNLRQWLGTIHPLFNVGLGTGLGYFFCNFPPFFTASPGTQAVASALLCLGSVFIVNEAPTDPVAGDAEIRGQQSPLPFTRVLICFTALVWFDSAAFFIIQNTPALKAGTWEGALHLWINGIIHFIAALVSVWLIRRRGLSSVFSLAFAALAVACLLLPYPGRALLASAFYPVGVSLYSVALVAYPSLLAPAASIAERGRVAGWIYAVAGWFGSAMGIGMGQHLGHVPVAFIVVAGLLVFSPVLLATLNARRREAGAITVVALTAIALNQVIKSKPANNISLSPVQEGRQVYISEGCIHCHSQYVRPNTTDELIWGPTRTVEELHKDRPPLIGNRRQGPDLSEVGGRRSPLWLKAHLYRPAQLSPDSFMPSYAYLFNSSRGNNLVAYLESLRSGDLSQHLAAEQRWHISPASLARADAREGAKLFQGYCATCHQQDGTTRSAWRLSFKRLPPVFPEQTYLHIDPSDTTLGDNLGRIIKFGIPGTDMPGHEYLSDSQVASISAWLRQQITQSAVVSELHHPNFSLSTIASTGEKK